MRSCSVTVGHGTTASHGATASRGTTPAGRDASLIVRAGTSPGNLRLGVFEPGEWSSYRPVTDFAAATGQDPSLVLIYSGYVAEVYRAGIESVHPSQEAAARSLGLSHAKTLRFVIIPQAVRRVIPPLLNDFIGLQKDSALVALIGPIEAFRQSQIDVAATFNYPPIWRRRCSSCC